MYFDTRKQPLFTGEILQRHPEAFLHILGRIIGQGLNGGLRFDDGVTQGR